MSGGEFVGMVADNPDQKIELKIFHSEILNDHEAIRKEEESYVRNVTQQEIQQTYQNIKEDVKLIIEDLLPNAA